MASGTAQNAEDAPVPGLVSLDRNSQIWALAKKGAGILFNLQSVDNCPFFSFYAFSIAVS
jgi:hypothetical protein